MQQIEGDFRIFSNNSLKSLKGLDKLLKVKDAINIRNNSYLNDYCAMVNLFQNGIYGSPVSIENNAFNPTVTQLKDGNCSN